MKNKILILGKGYIAQRINEELGFSICDKRITCYTDLIQIVKRHKPDVLINCIGYIGESSVDDCEYKIDESLSANTFLPIWLGELALRTGIKVVHISSGCIYHYDYANQKPISEEDQPDYYDLFYSRTKIYSETVLKGLSNQCNILIVRIRIPLDDRPHSRNLLTKLIRYKKVINIPNSVTYIPDFIKALEYLLKINAQGIFNVVCKEALQYSDLVDMYKKYKPDFKYQEVSLKQLKLKRSNLILSVRKLERTGFKVRRIRDVLEGCVHSYLNS